MSILDQWFTGIQTAATSVATAIVGAVGAWFALRKRVSTDSADIKRTHLEMGWLERLVKKSEDDDKRIESLRESQLNDTRQIAKKEAEAEACRERMQEMRVERDLAMQDMVKAREDVAALKEHIVVLDGQILMARVANVRLFAALPDGLRQELAEHLLKQEPTKP